MDYLYFSLCIFAIFASSLGSVKVHFEDASKVDVEAGAKQLSFICFLNKGPMYMIHNHLDIVHINPVTKKESVMSTGGRLIEAKPEFYHVTVKQAEMETMALNFTILTVTDRDDGIYKCHIHGEGVDESAEKEIVVHKPFSSLKLKFGDFDPIDESPADPIQIDHGEYEVTCVTEGSNPATKDLELSFHGLKIHDGEPSITAMEGSERKFKSEVSGKLNIVVSNSGQEVTCQASDSTGQEKTVALKIEVNIYDPEVTCNDTEAHIGQDNPMLYCTVNYTGLDVVGYAYQIGDSGEIVKENADNPKNIVVTSSDVAPGIAVVSLDLHKAEPEYLDKNYYILIYMKGEHTSKESVRLHRKAAPTGPGYGVVSPGSGNGGGGGGLEGHGERFSPAGFLYVLMLVTALWSWH